VLRSQLFQYRLGFLNQAHFETRPHPGLNNLELGTVSIPKFENVPVIEKCCVCGHLINTLL
jgi:hypothetical protein